MKTILRGWLIVASSIVLQTALPGLRAQTEPALPDFGAAILRDWVQPAYPPAARSAKLEGKVHVEFVVEADGTVSRESVVKSTDERFDDAALTAVRQWKFKPAVENGTLVASAMRVDVVFQLAQLNQKSVPLSPPETLRPQPLPEIPAKEKGSIDPEYPAELEASKIPGEVHLEFAVDDTGQVEHPRVLWATHPAFVETSLRAIRRAEFTPARQGPLTKRSVKQLPVGFESMGARTADILEANHLALLSSDGVVVLPRPLMLIRPVYPQSRLLAGETGNAIGEFTLNEKGQTREITIVSADHAEFGAALQAAIESWAFKPAQGDHGPIPARFRVSHEFGIDSSPTETRLAGLLKPGGAGIGGPGGLDGKLAPLWRGFPVYPQAFLNEPIKGDALIEFIIDREGRARLPKIVSATEEAFGWAAATAIAQWVFERPMRGGEPVDVTVRIPVGFKPPGT
jgi:TonB family protein